MIPTNSTWQSSFYMDDEKVEKPWIVKKWLQNMISGNENSESDVDQQNPYKGRAVYCSLGQATRNTAGSNMSHVTCEST